MISIEEILNAVHKLPFKERVKLTAALIKEIKEYGEGSNEWDLMTAEEFFRGYSEKDSVYDQL